MELDKMAISQLIENQMILMKKTDTMIKLLGDISAILLKYDEEYQKNAIMNMNK